MKDPSLKLSLKGEKKENKKKRNILTENESGGNFVFEILSNEREPHRADLTTYEGADPFAGVRSVARGFGTNVRPLNPAVP